MSTLRNDFEAPFVLVERCETFAADHDEPGICTNCGWLHDELGKNSGWEFQFSCELPRGWRGDRPDAPRRKAIPPRSRVPGPTRAAGRGSGTWPGTRHLPRRDS